MNLSPRNKLIVVVALAVVAVVAVGILAIVPTSQRLGDLSAKTATAIQDADSARTLLEQRYQVKNQAAQTDAKLIELAVAVPQNPDLPSLIIDLQDTAYDSGVVLRGITPQAMTSADAKTAYVEVPVSMKVWGTWADTVDFVDRLEKLPRQLRIDSFQSGVLAIPSTDEDRAGTGLSFPPYYQVETQMLVTAYVVPAQSSASSSSVPAATTTTP